VINTVSAAPIDLNALSGAVSSLGEAATSMFTATINAKAQIREAEIQAAETLQANLIGQYGPILSTLDRPFFITNHPNEGGGSSQYSVSMQTMVGLLVVINAWQNRFTNPEIWQQIQDSWVETFDYVPMVTEETLKRTETFTDGSGKTGKGKKTGYFGSLKEAGKEGGVIDMMTALFGE